jgi:hypothetical protein
VSAIVALFPPEVAVIDAVPAATAVINPDAEIVATFGALLDHVGGVLSVAPEASMMVPAACRVWPVFSVAVLGVIETLATVGLVTTSVALPAIPSTVAVTDTVPPPTAVTKPDDPTVATCVFEVLQATGRPVIELPSASAAVAVA